MLKIRELRKEKGITQEQLADAVNVKKYTIGDWERNRTEPNITTLVAMADYFEVSTDYLLGRSDDTGVVQANANLTPDEEEVLMLYRQMSYQDKNQLKGFISYIILNWIKPVFPIIGFSLSQKYTSR